MPDIDDMISQYDKKQEKQAKIMDELKSLKLENSRLRDDLNKSQKRIKELEEKIEGMVDFPTDVIELRSIIGRQRAQIATFEDQINERDFKLTELQTELSVIKDRYEKFRARLQSSEGLEVKLKEKDLRISELETEIATLQDRLEKTRGEAERVLAASYEKDLIEKDARIKTLEAELENIKQTHDKFKQTMNELRAKYHMDELTEEMAEFDFKELEAELTLQLKERDDIIKVNEEKIEKLMARQEKNLKQIEDLNSELVKIRAEKDELQEKLMDAERAKSAEIEEVTRELESRQAQLVRQFEREKEDIKKGFEEEMKRLEAMASEHSQLQKDLTDATAQVQRYKELIENMKKIFETDPNLKIFVIVDEAGPTPLETIAKAIGQSVANTRRIAMMLERRGLVKVENDVVSIPK
ncbi:MAG: hypothetical protein ACTSRW_12850 [Candidatus Helarchaeota archaeon]